jgi:hypothetical protein
MGSTTRRDNFPYALDTLSDFYPRTLAAHAGTNLKGLHDWYGPAALVKGAPPLGREERHGGPRLEGGPRHIQLQLMGGAW